MNITHGFNVKTKIVFSIFFLEFAPKLFINCVCVIDYVNVCVIDHVNMSRTEVRLQRPKLTLSFGVMPLRLSTQPQLNIAT